VTAEAVLLPCRMRSSACDTLSRRCVRGVLCWPVAWSWSLSSPPAPLGCRWLRSPLQHFSVDGTLIEAWASHKSFRPKDGSDDDGTARHVQKRSYDTHASTTDPDSRLDRKAAGR
jgi:hypothetical protein